MEREWDRVNDGFSDFENVSDVMAVIAAYQGQLTGSDIEQITGIGWSLIRKLFSGYAYLFNFTDYKNQALTPITKLNGYWHFHIQEYFISRISPNCMQRAHRTIGEWLIAQHGIIGISFSPPLIYKTLMHFVEGKDWVRVLDLTLNNDYVYTLAAIPEGQVMLPGLYRYAIKSAVNRHDMPSIIKALNRFSEAGRQTLLPCAAVWYCLGQKDRSLTLLDYMQEDESKDIERMRLGYLSHNTISHNTTAPVLSLHNAPTYRQLYSLRAEVLIQRKPATSWHDSQPTMGFVMDRSEGCINPFFRFACELARLNLDEAFRYFQDIASGIYMQYVAHAIVHFAHYHPENINSFLRDISYDWLSNLTEEDLNDIGGVLPDECKELYANALIQKATNSVLSERVLNLCATFPPPKEISKAPCTALEQAIVTAHLSHCINKLRVSPQKLLKLLPDWRFRICALEKLAADKVVINWDNEVKSLCAFLSNDNVHNPSTYMKTMLRLLNQYSNLSFSKRTSIADNLIHLYEMPFMWENEFVELLAVFTSKRISTIYLELIEKETRWFVAASFGLPDIEEPSDAYNFATQLLSISATLFNTDTKPFDIHGYSDLDTCIRRIRGYISAYDNSQQFLENRDFPCDISFREAIEMLRILCKFQQYDNEFSNSQMLLSLTRHFITSDEWVVYLPDIIVMFADTEPCLIGDLLKMPESRRLDIGTVQLETWGKIGDVYPELEVYIAGKYCGLMAHDAKKAQYFTEVIYNKRLTDTPLDLLRWADTLPSEKNRFIPMDTTTEDYQSALREFKWHYRVAAIECLLTNCPENILPCLSDDSMFEYVRCLALPFWCQVWQYYAAQNFEAAVDRFAKISPYEQDEGKRIRTDTAWDILVDTAITAPDNSREQYCSLLIKISAKDGIDTHSASEKNGELLKTSILNIICRHSKEKLPELLGNNNYDTAIYNDPAIVRCLISQGEKGIHVLRKALDNSDNDTIHLHVIFTQYMLEQYGRVSIAEACETFFVHFPEIPRSDLLYRSLSDLCTVFSYADIIQLIDYLVDGSSAIKIKTDLLYDGIAIPLNEWLKLTTAIIDHVQSNPAHKHIGIVYGLCSAVKYLPIKEGESLCLTLLDIIRKEKWPIDNKRHADAYMVLGLAENSIDIAMHFALSNNAHGSYGYLTQKVARHDRKKALKFAQMCIEALRRTGQREVNVDADIPYCPEYLGKLLEDPMHSNVRSLDHLFYECIDNVRNEAKRNPIKAFELAASCCGHPLTRHRVISELLWEYLESLDENTVRWIADEAPEEVVIESASRIVPVIAGNFPEYALKIISRANIPGLLGDLLTENTSMVFREKIQRCALEMMRKHEEREQYLKPEQVKDVLQIILMGANIIEVYNRIIWTTDQGQEYIQECMPVLLEALISKSPRPEKVIDEILDTIGVKHNV